MHEIENVLGDDEHAEVLDLFLDGAHAASLSADRAKPKARVRVELGPGFHVYELRGVATMKDGSTRPITGSGTIAFGPELRAHIKAAPDLAAAARTQ